MSTSTGSTTAAPTDSTTGPAETVTDSGPADGSSSSSDGETAETGYDPPAPMCGNGYVEGDEDCDDGNRVDDDECNNACQVPCGLEWSVLILGPTLDSEIEGRSIVRDADDQIVVSGHLREITAQMDGSVIEGDDTVLVQSFDPGGGMVWEQVFGTPEGDAAPGGVAVDAAGEVYVAATLDAVDGGTAIRVMRLSSADGTVVWTHDFDGPLPGTEEQATGIAVGPDGQPVVAGHVRVADGDDDLWVRTLSSADGSEAWTETYSGVGSGMFSTDRGGPVAVASDGGIYALGILYEDFQTRRATLLRYEAGGGPPTWTYTPDVDGIPDQVFGASALTVTSDGGAMMTIFREGALKNSYWVVRLDAAGQEQWMVTHEQFEMLRVGSDWRIEGTAAHGDELLVMGRYVDDQRGEGAQWWESFVARLYADGSTRCQVQHGRPSDGFFTPSLLTYAVTTSSLGSAVVTGEVSSQQEAGLWLGSFRD